jgi:hypothetical protein
MPAHHLKHERSLVRSGGGVDAIDGLADSMQCGRSTNRQVGHGHIVVDRPDESDDLEVPMLDGLSVGDSSCLIVGVCKKTHKDSRHSISLPEA